MRTEAPAAPAPAPPAPTGPAAPAPPAAAPAPPARAEAVAIRTYRPSTGGLEPADGTPLTILMLVTTTPAVLAAALLRPRSQSAANRRGRA
ncbi:hypothetical protein ACH4D4_21595 [Streptomyces pristinaespiralis]|uniref:hypothetical protein n=1 Tax=Streptomyces pristinaespiralis TaxID=38300 RepID=UPI0037AC37F7